MLLTAAADYKVANQTSKSGSVFFKSEPSSSTQRMTQSCGSSLQICVASQTVWLWPKRLSTLCYPRRGCVPCLKYRVLFLNSVPAPTPSGTSTYEGPPQCGIRTIEIHVGKWRSRRESEFSSPILRESSERSTIGVERTRTTFWSFKTKIC